MNTDNRVTADRRDRTFAWIYLLVGYGFIHTFFNENFGRNLAIFTALYVVVVLAYNLGKGKKLTTESVFWACVVIGIGVPGAFWSIMPFLQVLALIVAAAYWTLTASGRLLEEGAGYFLICGMRASSYRFPILAASCGSCWEEREMVPAQKK